jgi:hypothetical protein
MGALREPVPEIWVKSRKPPAPACFRFATAGLHSLIARMAGRSPKVQLVLLVGAG